MIEQGQHHRALDIGGLLDFAEARHWLGRLEEATKAGLYAYQIPWSRASGRRVDIQDRACLSVSSYSYLGLDRDPRVIEAGAEALRRYGCSTGGVRFLTGTTTLHLELEEGLSRHLEQECVTTFGSGYAANLSAIASLAGPGDAVVLDKLDHRSIYEGARLSGARIFRFPHNDVERLDSVLAGLRRFGRKLLCLEGVYSMGGDVPPLPALIETARRHGAHILLDEAHAIGVLGRQGAGTLSYFDLPSESVDVVTGSLSKAIPASGGFVAGSRLLADYLRNTTGGFVYSAALSPPAAACALAAIHLLAEDPGPQRFLHRNTERLREKLREHGVPVAALPAGIIPLRVGRSDAAFAAARWLLEEGVFAGPVCHPAVPRGQAILRVCGNASYTDGEIDLAASLLGRALARALET